MRRFPFIVLLPFLMGSMPTTDANGDSEISMQEHLIAFERLVSLCDKDGDGFFTDDEARDFQNKSQDVTFVDQFHLFDKDEDGLLEADEYMALRRATDINLNQSDLEAMIDSNGDGMVSETESAAFLAQSQAKSDRAHVRARGYMKLPTRLDSELSFYIPHQDMGEPLHRVDIQAFRYEHIVGFMRADENEDMVIDATEQLKPF